MDKQVKDQLDFLKKGLLGKNQAIVCGNCSDAFLSAACDPSTYKTNMPQCTITLSDEDYKNIARALSLKNDGENNQYRHELLAQTYFISKLVDALMTTYKIDGFRFCCSQKFLKEGIGFFKTGSFDEIERFYRMAPLPSIPDAIVYDNGIGSCEVNIVVLDNIKDQAIQKQVNDLIMHSRPYALRIFRQSPEAITNQTSNGAYVQPAVNYTYIDLKNYEPETPNRQQ